MQQYWSERSAFSKFYWFFLKTVFVWSNSISCSDLWRTGIIMSFVCESYCTPIILTLPKPPRSPNNQEFKVLDLPVNKWLYSASLQIRCAIFLDCYFWGYLQFWVTSARWHISFFYEWWHSCWCWWHEVSQSIFESACLTILPKFVNVMLWAHTLMFGIDSSCPRFSSDALLAILSCFSRFVSCPNDAALVLSMGPAGHEWWMIRAEQNSQGKSCKSQRQPLLVALLVLRFEHGQRLLDQLSFAILGFKEAPSKWPVIYQKEIISIYVQLGGHALPSPNFAWRAVRRLKF